MAKGRDIDEVQGSAAKSKRPSDVVDLFKLGPKYTTVRFVGPVFMYGGHWVKTKNKEGKPANFYTGCLAFDPETGRRDTSKKCPWCDHDGEEVRFSIDYYSNALIRREQKNRPERLTKPTKTEESSGFKDKDSDTWTPYGAIRMPYSVIRGLKELKELNVHEDSEGTSTAYNVSHPKFGIDVMLKKDDTAAPALMYSVQKGEHKAVSKEERTFLQWDLSDLAATPDPKAINDDYVRWAKKMGFVVKGSDDDEDDEAPRGKKKAKADPEDTKSGFEDDDEDDMPKAKPKKKPPVDEDDEDDEPTPKSKAKSKAPIDDDEDDEDDLPKAKAKKKPPVDEDEDDEDDLPTPKTKSKAKAKPPVDEDDEDDEPAPKAKAKAKRPPVEDDEDDEPVPKSKKKKPPVEDDDDEDF